MMKEILTEEKVKQRWQQMEEMNMIWDHLTEREKGYLDGCMNTVIALASQKRAGQEAVNMKKPEEALYIPDPDKTARVFYSTLAKILSKKHGVDITATVTKKEKAAS